MEIKEGVACSALHFGCGQTALLDIPEMKLFSLAGQRFFC